LHQPFSRFDFAVKDLLLQPFVDLVGDGIGGFQEMDLSLPISEGDFPVHEEFSPQELREKIFLINTNARNISTLGSLSLEREGWGEGE
jgi:hypothetical protein